MNCHEKCQITKLENCIENMTQNISQGETRKIIINDMVKKRNSIVPIIGEDSIVYQDKDAGKEIPFPVFNLLIS